MSQAGLFDIEQSHPQIATSYVTDSGTAIPVLNALEILGSGGISTTGSGNTVTCVLETPLTVPYGGTGTITNTDGGILLGSGANAITALGRAANGQIPIGFEDTDPVLATLTPGTGISITNAAGSITITNTAGGFSWSVVTGGAQTLAVQNGYIGNRGTAIVYTLPATAAVGEAIQITNIGAGLPQVAQNAGQSINFTASTTTVGVGGSLTAIDQFSSIELICVVADTTFNIVDSVGNWTIV